VLNPATSLKLFPKLKNLNKIKLSKHNKCKITKRKSPGALDCDRAERLKDRQGAVSFQPKYKKQLAFMLIK